MRRTIVILSGGIDSATLLHHQRAAGDEVRALSVDYGQRHRARELAAAEAIAAELGVERRVLDLRGLAAFFGANSLTDAAVDVPEGAYSATTMALTVVPNRNMLLVAAALAWAAADGGDAVAFGAHGGAYTPYPDCRPEFAAAMGVAARVCDARPLEVLAPFVTWTKADIVRRAIALGVPLAATWSCYAGGDVHCGRCGTCLDRQAAFAETGVTDPTAYLP
jgi:7-cyano-7-deazaguanine synthase